MLLELLKALCWQGPRAHSGLKISPYYFREILGPHIIVLDWKAEKRFVKLHLYSPVRKGMTCLRTKYLHYFGSLKKADKNIV